MAKDENTGWPGKGQWRTARGKLLRIRRMDDGHLGATQKWLRRVLANARMEVAAAFFFVEEEGEWDHPFPLMFDYLCREAALSKKLAKFDAEVKRRKGLVYRLTHRKRPEPRATLLSERTVRVRF